MCKVMIDGKQVEMLVDSGASVDLIDEKSFRELYKDKKEEIGRASCRERV